MRLHYLQHVPFEGLSMIAEWAQANNHSINCTKFYQNDYKLPTADDFDMLVVMGGPMSVNDDTIYSWLAEERACIKAAIDADKYVLGVCLGAQQIARVLGAQVKANPCKEIGWYPIAFTDQALSLTLLSGLNNAMTVLHWHGETFDIPAGAIQLASSAVCANQGFLYQDKVLALQFHIEMDTLAVEQIVESCSNELIDEEHIQSESTILEGTKRYHLKRALFRLLDNWIVGDR